MPIVKDIFGGFVDAFGEAHQKITDTNTAAGAIISTIETLAVGIGAAVAATKLWNIATAAATALLAHPIGAVAIGSIGLLTTTITGAKKAWDEYVGALYQLDEVDFDSVVTALAGINTQINDLFAKRESAGF